MSSKKPSRQNSLTEGSSHHLYESADKASSEILSRLGFPDGVDGKSKTSLDLQSVGLMSGDDGRYMEGVSVCAWCMSNVITHEVSTT